MHHFNYRQQVLFAEDVDLREIAAKVGTPCFVYSQATLIRHMKAFGEAFKGLDPLICLAVKANTNRAVIATFAAMGGGVDIVSGGEMYRSLAAGVPADRIVYSGVGKTIREMELGLENGILMFNIESIQEMHMLNQVAGRLGVKAPVSFRVNPDVDAKTHPKITTGLAVNKFGLTMEDAFEQYQVARALPNLELKGISCHIGSQLTQTSPFADALNRLVELISKLRAKDIELELLDLGGGLGITYDHETPPEPAEYAATLRETLEKLGMRPVLEPGRALVGNAGILLSEVVVTKKTPVKNFVVLDAAMNDLMRPSFYGSYHGVQPVQIRKDQETITADVVGPICETGDFLAKDREVPRFEPGDLVALMSAGAYGYTMSSNYNSRPRAPEVLVNGDKWAVVKTRETYEDLCRGESLPNWME
jgi:diaminopimelate decarboxylase